MIGLDPQETLLVKGLGRKWGKGQGYPGKLRWVDQTRLVVTGY